MSREEVLGHWVATVDDHTIELNLSSDGTAGVHGIPVAATTMYDSYQKVELDWSDVADLSGTWSYYEPYAGNRASIFADLSKGEVGDDLSLGSLVLEGAHVVLYYGYIEFADRLVFTKSKDQPAQPDSDAVSRQAFVGTWVAGEAPDQAIVEFDVDGTMTFSNLPRDLLRSDGSAEIDWRRTVSFTADWSWSQAPIDESSFVMVSLPDRPLGTEFDGAVMDVSVVDSFITLRMRSGQVVWDRHLDFHRSARDTK